MEGNGLSTEPSPDAKFEIGHVFVDIVGYSKLLINEQSEQLETLKKVQYFNSFSVIHWT
jgi:hypothetical protein